MASRRAAARRERRLIVNNDGNDASGIPGPITPELFLEQRTSALAGTHVSSIFYCTGVVNQYTHWSEECEFRGDHDRWRFARDLVERGTDTLQVMTEWSHRNGIEVFWSMRMNDTHDYARDINFTQWKRAHPEYLMGKPGDKVPWGGEANWDARWSTLDYGREEVREKIFRILRDVCSRYDVDGIELDFFRHPLYFRPQYHGEPITDDQRALMTGLLHRIRAMTEEAAVRRGRPLLIAARVPDSLGYAREIGLDVAEWLEQDLVDMLIGTCYFQLEPWHNFAQIGRKYNIPVYACLSGSRFVDPGNTRIKLPLESWYGDALNAWQAGVDGIYLFNVFDPRDARFRQLGDPTVLRDLPRSSGPVTGSPWRPDYWLRDGSRFRQLAV